MAKSKCHALQVSRSKYGSRKTSPNKKLARQVTHTRAVQATLNVSCSSAHKTPHTLKWDPEQSAPTNHQCDTSILWQHCLRKRERITLFIVNTSTISIKIWVRKNPSVETMLPTNGRKYWHVALSARSHSDVLLGWRLCVLYFRTTPSACKCAYDKNAIKKNTFFCLWECNSCHTQQVGQQSNRKQIVYVYHINSYFCI